MPRFQTRPNFARHVIFTLLIALAGCCAIAFGFLSLAPRTSARSASVFVVNSTGLGLDSNTSDGLCDDGTGNCTLYAAIQQANATPGADTINFQIGSGGAQTIRLGGGLTPALPVITDPLTLDATTQPGYAGVPLIILDGLGSGEHGVIVTAGNSTVRGFNIKGTLGPNVSLEGGSGSVVSGNQIARRVQIINSNDNTIGGTNAGDGNSIGGGSGSDALRIEGSSGNVIQGNAILGSGGGGVVINGSNNLIGGTTAAAGNHIAGHEGGVGVSGSGNIIQGNTIEGNIFSGIRVNGSGTVIGGLTAIPGTAPGNVIRRNGAGLSNIEVQSQGVGVVILGNLITSSTVGVECRGSGDTLVGGTGAGARNVISSNGIGVRGCHTVQGNYIGTDITGTIAMGNGEAGVRGGTLIGGASPAARNVISGNGIGIINGGINGGTVQGNFIGTDATGAAPLPNRDGVVILPGARGLVIGGAADGAGNLIAFNDGDGIRINSSLNPDSTPANNTIRGNRIFSNKLLGIDLGSTLTEPVSGDGLTLNDQGDTDAGPNGLQNFPVLLSVTTAGGVTTVQGTLNSTPNNVFTIDIYANAACDPSGQGEGQAYAGSTTVTTDAGGNGAFSAVFPAPAAGQIFTATTTDPTGNTSEFSFCYEAGASGTVQFTSAAFGATEKSGAVTINVTRTLGTAAAATVDFNTADGTASNGEDYVHVSGTLHFAPGETTKSFIVPVLDDALDEDEESVTLRLSNPTGGITLGARNTASLDIADDDEPPQFLPGNPVVVAEGNSGMVSAVFNIRLSAASGKVITVSYGTLNGSAQSPEDFQTVSGMLVFNPGETSKSVAVPVNGDTQPENDETFTFRLSAASNAAPLPGGSLSISGIIFDDDDSPGIRFAAADFSVREDAGSATVTVVRRGDTASAASVDYEASSNLSASLRSDYTPAFGTLHFAPGQTERSFTVLVNDDAYIEEPETVFLRLLSPQGGTLAGSGATLTITSEDAQPPTPANNPVNDTAFFVRQHYHDFLNREPDAAGLQFWADNIESCGADARCREVRRVDTSAAFFLSIEFQRTGYLVIRLYRASFTGTLLRPRGLPRHLEFLRVAQELGRGVIVGVGNWEEQLRENTLAFARRWVGSSEFTLLFPTGMSAAQFVDKLFANSGATPTPAERDAAIAAFGAGGTEGRAAALLSVLDSASVNDAQFAPAFVLLQYFGYLRRDPDAAPDTNFDGYNFWLTKLNQFNGDFRRAEMVKAFISSTEYRQRFGQ